MARRIALSPRYLKHARALGVVGGSVASQATGAVARVLATAPSLPLEGDVYTFLPDAGDGVQVLAHCRRVPGRNHWLWYWSTEEEVQLVGLTSTPPVVRGE
jgi:hypothetical protein